MKEQRMAKKPTPRPNDRKEAWQDRLTIKKGQRT